MIRLVLPGSEDRPPSKRARRLPARAAGTAPALPDDPLGAAQQAIGRSKLFAGWNEAARLELAQASVVRALAESEMLARAGEPDASLYLIVSGALRLVGSAGEGRAFDAAILLPGDSYNLMSVFDGGPALFDVVAREACVVLDVPSAALVRAVRATPDGWLPIAQALAERVRQAMRYSERTARAPVRVRLARVLLELHERGLTRRAGRAQREGGAAGEIAIPISQQAIASMLSVTRPTVNGELKRLEQQQMVVANYGQIRILDLPALARLAEER